MDILDENQTVDVSSEEQTSYPVEVNMLNDTIGFISGLYSSNTIDEEQLKHYIQYPMRHNRQIRGLCKRIYNLNGICGRTIDKMVAAPTLDYIIIPNGIEDEKKKNADKLNYYLKKINHKLSTRDALFSALTEGMYVAILRNTKHENKNITIPGNPEKIGGLALSENIMLQPLDKDYVKFIGFMNGDYVCAFDMQYFDQFKSNGLVAEIKHYPSEFIRAYNKYRRDGSKRWFLLDQKNTFAFKYRSQIDEPYGRPLALSALNDILFAEDYTDSQRGNLRENTSTIHWLIQPEGERPGQCSLNRDQQTAQYENFKNAVYANAKRRNNKMVQASTVVFAPGTQLGKVETDNTLIKETLTRENMSAISTDLGLALAALNGEGEGANYSSLAVNLDLLLAEVFQMLEQIEIQYTKILNNFLGLSEDEWVDIHYLKTSVLNRDKAFEVAKDLYTTAGGSRLYLYAVGTGDSNTYLRLMDYEKEMGFDEKYPPHTTSFTVSDSSDNEGGRPNKNDPDLKDGGLEKTHGGNKQKRVSKK